MAYTFKHGDRPVDGYTIQRAVGRGGFGEVYYAVSDGGREVAIKYLRDNPQVELRGVSLVINLKSPHLVSIFDVKKTDEDDYAIIMEYCSGPSLRDLLIAEPSGFAPEKAAFFLREIGKGLAYLHDHGIVHRDLKPGNIFFDDAYVKIGDYGLSKIISVSRHSAQTASVGTVHYMAPEIGSGNYSRGVDIYALGVMLYEMLLGAVPFEGSTMAEVLMKHLTSQPELDQLPQPFAKVVRKALEKDPKDRYQTVDEMVEELLGAADIRKSVAGFSAKSLQNAVAQAGGARHVSPVPSPNPMPRVPAQKLPPFAIPVGSRGALTGKAKKRMDRIARKVERKRAKLAGRRPNDAVQVPPKLTAATKRLRRRRMLLTGVMGAALSIGLGIVCASSTGNDEIGATVGMLVPALTLAIALGRKSRRWFGVEDGPGWAAGMIRAACAAPLLAIASAPVMDRFGEGGVAVWVAMSLIAMFFSWDKTLDESASGEMSFGRAFWAGLATLIVYSVVSGIMRNGPQDEIMFGLAGAAAITSLILQASSWWLGPVGGPRRDPPGHGYDNPDDADPGNDSGTDRATGTPATDETVALGNRPNRLEQTGAAWNAAQERSATVPRHPRQRWGIARAFWGLLSFLTLCGSITTFIVAIVTETRELRSGYNEQTALILACIGLASASIFALRKTTAIKRDGFWRESLRPFLQSALLFAVGGAITGIAREWDSPNLQYEYRSATALVHGSEEYGSTSEATTWQDSSWEIEVAPARHDHDASRGLPDGEKAAIISVLVISSMLLLGLTLFTGRGERRAKGFLTDAAPRTSAPAHGLTSDSGRIVAVGHQGDVDPLASHKPKA